jgi:hypothetical protein
MPRIDPALSIVRVRRRTESDGERRHFTKEGAKERERERKREGGRTETIFDKTGSIPCDKNQNGTPIIPAYGNICGGGYRCMQGASAGRYRCWARQREMSGRKGLAQKKIGVSLMQHAGLEPVWCWGAAVTVLNLSGYAVGCCLKRLLL